jgi:hypothetical protein
MAGVLSAEVSPVTGSVIIYHDPELVDRRDLARMLEAAGCRPPEAFRRPHLVKALLPVAISLTLRAVFVRLTSL